MRSSQVFRWCLFAGACLCGVLGSRVASAQEEDLRGILPYLMLVVDTSGSMERLPACKCTTPACEECLPQCDLTNDVVTGLPPAGKKNRWAVTLEALTGTFENFQCEPIERTGPNGMTYDLGYYLDYHQPWDCDPPADEGEPCAYDGANTLAQSPNGILDVAESSVRFGLMTFDGWDTYVGASNLVPEPDFDVDLSNDVQGLWSYAGPKSFHYPNCTTDYMMDTGVRSAAADQGSLVGLAACSGGVVGSPTCPAWCTACPSTQESINRDIQEALLAARPYGGTPIAASLDDLYYHFKSDAGDAFAQCRFRYAMLLTDGYPDDDWRKHGCNCANEGDPMDPNYDSRCGPPPNDPADMHCPYPTAEEVAEDLVQGRGTDGAMIEQLFVVGLAVDDDAVIERLDDIATAGCVEEDCDPDDDMHSAYFATDLETLVTNITEIVQSISPPVSRTTPTFSGGVSADEAQYKFSTGLKLPEAQGEPWTGVLERQRFDCSLAAPPPAPVGQNGDFATLDQSEGDLFHEVLNLQPTRDLWTAVPSGGIGVNGNLNKTQGVNWLDNTTNPCGTSGCPKRPLDDSLVTEAMLQVPNAAARTALLDWMYGRNGSVRDDKRLGAIYHSTPVIVGSPTFDTADDLFNQWRQRDLITGRPQVLYVSSTDGILHAFSVSNYSAPAGGEVPSSRNLADGEEIWGFVPPMLLDEIRDNTFSPRELLDATPVVENVYFNRVRSQLADLDTMEYRTVLISGFRAGGAGYFALDVTNPFEPKFLWQLTDPAAMGKSYGQPAIVQAKFRRPPPGGGADIIKEGAVAILPGGNGLTAATGCINGALTPAWRTGAGTGSPPYATFSQARPIILSGAGNLAEHRSDIQCWQSQGRSLYFVDIEDGYVLKRIFLTDGTVLPAVPSTANPVLLPSPLVSTPAPYPDGIGTLSTRAFITDADGVIWRIDMSAINPERDFPMNGWTVRPFHDLFWDRAPNQGERSYLAPLLAVDELERPVVMVGSGEPNTVKLDIENRVVSLTEVVDPAVGGPATLPQHYKAAFNWEVRVKDEQTLTTYDDFLTSVVVDGLVPSEYVTGPMGFFEEQLFFGTFIAVTDGTNACDAGRGRVFAVDYLERDTADTNDSNPQTYGPKRVNAADGTSGGNQLINALADSAPQNVMVMGLTIAQPPSCTVIDTIPDVYGSPVPGIDSLSKPAIYLVSQADSTAGNRSIVEKRGGSSFGSVKLDLKKKNRSSRVVSWATAID